MKEIKLTQGKVALVDDGDYEHINKFKWYPLKGKNTIYAIRHKMIKGETKMYYMHRQILNLTDSKIYADHKDGNGLNNQRNNIRACTHSENRRNQRLHNGGTSQFKGVYLNKHCKKWHAQIRHNKKQTYLGVYESETDAAKAYNKAALEIFGGFANLNVIV